ncbi:amidohydrolase family protein [Streptomyces sp. NPDC004838]
MESRPSGWSRRRVLAGLGLVVGAAASGTAACDGGRPAEGADPQPTGTPPGRTVIRKTLGLTMDPGLGDVEDADILIDNGTIERVGTSLKAGSATEIDGRGMITMPGFVDTHNHLWLTQMRGLFANTRDTAYFSLSKRLGRHYRAEDIKTGTLLGAAELLWAGVTTTVDFCDNVRRPDYAEQALRAHQAAGLRARYLYGPNDDLPAGKTVDLKHLEQLADDWEAAWSAGGLLTLGLGWRGPGGGSREEEAVAREEMQTARRLRLPVSTHASGPNGRKQLDGLIEGRYLGTDVQVIHATDATSEQLDALNRAGAALALTPVTEQRVGYGITRLADYARVRRLGLGIDGNALAGSGDMFGAMRLLALTESGSAREETAVDPRRVLELATIEAAHAIGLGSTVGSLTPGKQADIIMINTDSPGMGRFLRVPPPPLVLYSAQPADVDTVLVAGRLVKRHGRLLHTDLLALLRRAEESMQAVARRAGLQQDLTSPPKSP